MLLIARPKTVKEKVMRVGLLWAIPILGVVAATSIVVADPALAFAKPNPPSLRPAPAPLIGVGLPLVGGVLAALALVRRFRRKD